MPNAGVSVKVLHNIPKVRLSFKWPTYCRLAEIVLDFVRFTVSMFDIDMKSCKSLYFEIKCYSGDNMD